MTLDRGEYRYLLNGEPTEVTESWVRQQQADGSWRIESERKAPGVHLAVSARGSGRRVRDFAVTWEASQFGNMAADYRPREQGMVATIWQGNRAQKLPAIDASALLLSPLMRIFAGPLIADILDAGGQARVLVPDIRDPGDSSALLRPLVSERSARLVGEQDALREVEYLGDQYGAGTRFWLRSDDLLQRYSWQQDADQFWEVSLECAD